MFDQDADARGAPAVRGPAEPRKKAALRVADVFAPGRQPEIRIKRRRRIERPLDVVDVDGQSESTGGSAQQVARTFRTTSSLSSSTGDTSRLDDGAPAATGGPTVPSTTSRYRRRRDPQRLPGTVVRTVFETPEPSGREPMEADRAEIATPESPYRLVVRALEAVSKILEEARRMSEFEVL